MNEMVNTFLLRGDNLDPEVHLIQLGFTYIACGLFTKCKEIIQKVDETGDSRYIYQNKLGWYGLWKF